MPRSLVAALLLAATALAAAAQRPTAEFIKTSDTGGGWSGVYVIDNPGDTLWHWGMAFELADNVYLDLVVNGWFTRNGNRISLHPELWNGTVPAGGKMVIDLKGSYLGQWAAPANCQLNSQPCDGSEPQPDREPPTAPAGLQADAVAARSVTLSWGAASDNVGVERYELLRDGADAGSASGTRHTVAGLQPETAYQFVVRAADAAGNRSASSEPLTVTTAADDGDQPPLAGGPRLAPYIDVTLWPPFDLAAARQDSGVDHYSLGFIVGGGDSCRASWGGYYDMEDDFYREQIDALRAAGGDVIASFGGASGRELAQVCGDDDALRTQYQAVIDRYGLRHVDFDIEGAALADSDSVARRNRAIAGLQAAAADRGASLYVSYTLPVLPPGLTQDGVALLQDAIDAGVRIDRVNIMAMNYGAYYAPEPAGNMAEYAIEAARSTHAQLAGLLPQRSAAERWAMLAVTPMIGQNDVAAEVFQLQDARQLGDFARAEGLGMLSQWSANRDRVCETPKAGADPGCSGVEQREFEFSTILREALAQP